MPTAKEYSKLDNFVYKVDVKKEIFPKRKGDQVVTKGGTYEVLKTVDTNDRKNSHGYDTNGFQGMAVAPVNKAGEVDYSHITVAYAGTNQSDFKDIAEDLQGIGSGNRSTVDIGEEGQHNIIDSQFNSALKFYQQVYTEFPDAKKD